MMQACIICGKGLIPGKTLYDDRYGYPGLFSVQNCCACGHKSLDAEFTLEELGTLYTEYYPRSLLSVDQHKSHVESNGFRAWLDGAKYSAFRWVPRNVRILDIGCGFGETLGYHKERGCDVYGAEADENIRRVAEKYGYNVNVGLFDADNYEKSFFDYVTMDQVLEHVANPVEVLRQIAVVMKVSGFLIVSTPNVNGWGARVFGRKWINWHPPYHLQFFSDKSMEILADKAGFDLERIDTVTCSDWLNFQWNHLFMYPAMGEHSMYWDPQTKRSLRQKLIIRLLMFLHWTGINHFVTRLFDALGIGDNYIFVLRKR